MIFPLFGCPFVTGSLPHSPQFVVALANKEVVKNGNSEKTVITSVYENRVAPLLVNVLILCCLPIIGQLAYIPTAVICDGLFLYMGITGLSGNFFFERLKLLITDTALYPTMHFSYDEVPKSRMHVFTLAQLIVVAVLFAVAKSPIAVFFPVFLVSSIPFRMFLHKITGGFITAEQVQILDFSRKPASDQVEAEACDQAAENQNVEEGAGGSPAGVASSEPKAVPADDGQSKAAM